MLFTCQSMRSTPIISSTWIPSTFVPFPWFGLQRKNYGLFNKCVCCPQNWFRCLGVGVRAGVRTEAHTSISRLAQLIERVTSISVIRSETFT